MSAGDFQENTAAHRSDEKDPVKAAPACEVLAAATDALEKAVGALSTAAGADGIRDRGEHVALLAEEVRDVRRRVGDVLDDLDC